MTSDPSSEKYKFPALVSIILSLYGFDIVNRARSFRQFHGSHWRVHAKKTIYLPEIGGVRDPLVVYSFIP